MFQCSKVFSRELWKVAGEVTRPRASFAFLEPPFLFGRDEQKLGWSHALIRRRREARFARVDLADYRPFQLKHLVQRNQLCKVSGKSKHDFFLDVNSKRITKPTNGVITVTLLSLFTMQGPTIHHDREQTASCLGAWYQQPRRFESRPQILTAM